MLDTRRANVLILVVAAVLAGCAAPREPAPLGDHSSGGGAVRFQSREVRAASPGCGTPDTPCARLTVVLAEPTDGGSEELRENLDTYARHWVVSHLRQHLADDTGRSTASLDQLAAAFLAQHRAFVEEFPDASADWYVEIEVAPLHSTAKVATLDLSISSYTGGAHPNTERQLVSFTVDGGRLLGTDDLTTDLDALTAVVERRFREARELTPDEDLESAGFWLTDGRFTLPDNLGVVADGLLVHWNAYEIAPYSMGPTTALVPVGDLDGIVTLDLW